MISIFGLWRSTPDPGIYYSCFLCEVLARFAFILKDSCSICIPFFYTKFNFFAVIYIQCFSESLLVSSRYAAKSTETAESVFFKAKGEN